jgi:hypothetical protein
LLFNILKKEIQDYVYQLHDSIGQGSYNKVFRGYNKNTKEPVAIKVSVAL